MSLLGNILWLLLGGLIAGLGYLLGGALLCVTIVGIPFGLQAIKLGVATFAPFGKQVVTRPGGDGCLPVVFNVLWIVLFGWEIAIAHLLSAAVLAITIVGIPFALQHVKLVPLALFPFGRDLVPADEARPGA
ncbi:MAG TPA: YccF domain-containing protein [Thermoanaerobaculia bacterium]|nr:YccF domain-containing protein [Thermoanaerobaculia bacterium]